MWNLGEWGGGGNAPTHQKQSGKVVGRLEN